MKDTLSYEEAKNIALKAIERYERAETKGEVEDLFHQYGRDGIGYRPLCRIIFSKTPVEKVLAAYLRREENKFE